jgi:hypothetical protein
MGKNNHNGNLATELPWKNTTVNEKEEAVALRSDKIRSHPAKTKLITRALSRGHWWSRPF